MLDDIPMKMSVLSMDNNYALACDVLFESFFFILSYAQG